MEAEQAQKSTSEVAERKEKLAEELSANIQYAEGKAVATHRLSLVFMSLALLCSVAAAACGIFFNVSSKIVGGIALLPALIAYVAVNLKLEAKFSLEAASWCSRNLTRLAIILYIADGIFLFSEGVQKSAPSITHPKFLVKVLRCKTWAITYSSVLEPFTEIFCPVTNPAPSLARKATAFATS